MRHRKSVTTLSTVALAVATCAVAVTAAPPPAAALPGLTTVTGETADDSAPIKTATATCPAGTAVIGGGGHSTDHGAIIQLTGMRPVVTGFGSGYQVTGTEPATGLSDAWQLRAYAICAPAPAGLAYWWTVTESNSKSSRDMAVHCPAGKQVLGTGAWINNGGTQVALRRVRPLTGLTSVLAGAQEDATGYSGSWSLTVWAVCAFPPPGLQLVGASNYFDGEPWGNVVTTCPSRTRVHGVGGMVTGHTYLQLHAAFPYQADAVYASGALPGYDGAMGIHTWAICAT